jgi:hypothetical protein
MDTFKLPRLEKKKLRKQMWFYPADEKGNSLVAFPHKYKEDYDAMNQGIVQDIFGRKTPEEKEKRRKTHEKLDEEIYVSDEELRQYVDDIFAKTYRNSSYNILLEAKNHSKAKIGYFNFVNSYQKHLTEEGFGNICCMSVDYAKQLLKIPRSKNKKHKRHNC